MIMLFMMSIIILSTMFWASKTPHVLMISLLMSTLISAIMLGSLKCSVWLSYVLFLIFLGGVLILFTYVSSLSFSLLFNKLNMKHIMMFLPGTMMSGLIFYFFYLTPDSNYMQMSLMENMYIKNIIFPLASPVYMYLFMYLFITLIYVVFMMKNYYAPLRTMN